MTWSVTPVGRSRGAVGGYTEGRIYFAEAPTCGNDAGQLSPCATNGLEGTAAAVCTGNERETCYFDVSCKVLHPLAVLQPPTELRALTVLPALTVLQPLYCATSPNRATSPYRATARTVPHPLTVLHPLPCHASCKAGGLGCYAGGWESCRFCGFDFSPSGGTDYSSAACL